MSCERCVKLEEKLEEYKLALEFACLRINDEDFIPSYYLSKSKLPELRTKKEKDFIQQTGEQRGGK